jgi:hypothetical protein
MKIKQNTSERLIIEQGDLFVGYLSNLGCSFYLFTFVLLSLSHTYSLLGKVSFEIDDSQKDSDNDTIYKLFLVLNSGEKVNFDSGANETTIKNKRNLIEELVLSRIKL